MPHLSFGEEILPNIIIIIKIYQNNNNSIILCSGLWILWSCTQLWDTRLIDVGWSAADQEGQEFRAAFWLCWLFPSDKEVPSTVISGNRQEKPQIYTREIHHGSSKNVTELIAQLKSLHTNAHSMGNKQEESEATLQSENYNFIATSVVRRTTTLGHYDGTSSFGLSSINPQ